jgi:general secretion pathway protein G
MPRTIKQKRQFDKPEKTPTCPLGVSPYLAGDQRAFTLVELLVVTAIIGVLATMGLSAFNMFKENARRARCMSEIRGMEKDISAYAVERGAYPASLAEIGRADLLDPWGNLYHYSPYVDGAMRQILGANNSDYDLYSSGQDEATGASSLIDPGADDIIRFSDGGYVGMAKDF